MDEHQEAFDLDGLYREIGRFVVAFQALENMVWQLGVQALGVEDFDRSRRRLTGLTFHRTQLIGWSRPVRG